MLYQHLKLALRNIRRHPFFTSLHLLGLSLGLFSLMVLGYFIHHHRSYDQHHAAANQLFRVVHSLHLAEGEVEYDPGAPLAIGQAALSSLPEVENQAVFIERWSYPVAVMNAGTGHTLQKFNEQETIGLASDNWFTTMNHQWLHGNPATALSEPLQVVLTESASQRYFGQYSPIGQTLLVDNQHTFTISGVVADPIGATDYSAELYFSLASLPTLIPESAEAMATDWSFISSRTNLFLQLKSGADPSEVTQALNDLTAEHLGEWSKLYQYQLLSLTQAHFDTRFDGKIASTWLWALGGIAILLILIVSTNVINLSLAQAQLRAQEVGLRKLLGSSRSRIFAQFITETSLLCIISAFLGLVWLSISENALSTWLGIDFSHAWQQFSLWAIMIVGLSLLVFTAGAYPALVMSRMNPIRASKKQFTSQSKGRSALVIFQQAIALTLMMCTVILGSQLRYLQGADLGFQAQGIIMVPLPNAESSTINTLKDGLESQAGIQSLSFCNLPPLASGWGGQIKQPGGEWSDYAVRSRLVDTQYLSTFGIELIAGNNLGNQGQELLVNEALVSRLGYDHPEDILGRTIMVGEWGAQEGLVVGVVRNFHNQSLQSAIEPVILGNYGGTTLQAAIKLSGSNTTNTLADIQAVWEASYPESLFEFTFLEDQHAQTYQLEATTHSLIQATTLLAVALSSLGVLGLIALFASQRQREIGIRKVLGSTVFGILQLLSRDFIRWVAVAFIIATPIALLLMRQYLQDFAYRISLSWWMFALCGAFALVLTLCITSIQGLRAAKVNPASLLRSE